MKYWIDTSSSSDNIIVATDSALLIDSVDKEHHETVNQQLASEKSVDEVLGSDNLKTIPYIKMLGVLSRSTDKIVEVKYKTKDGPETEMVFFDSFEKKNAFVEAVESLIPKSLVKSEYQQNRFTAALWPIYSLAICAFVAFFYVNKLFWPVLIVCGLWAAISLWCMFARLSKPPMVTRWNIQGRHVRKVWYGLKTTASMALVLAIISAVSFQIPDSWGKKAISDRIAHEMLKADEIEQLLKRGADIDYVDIHGETPLYYAIYWEEDELAIALIEAGADLDKKYDGENIIATAIYNDASKDVIEALLSKGASLDFTIEDYSPIEYAREYGNTTLVTILENHMPTIQSSID